MMSKIRLGIKLIAGIVLLWVLVVVIFFFVGLARRGISMGEYYPILLQEGIQFWL
jgi:hypothetical protein